MVGNPAGSLPLDLMPNHLACREALFLAREELPRPMLHFGFRVFLYVSALLHSEVPPPAVVHHPHTSSQIQRHAHPRSPVWHAPVQVPAYALFVACILLPLGIRYDMVTKRPEVNAADHVTDILQYYGTNGEVLRMVWLAVALHTTHEIAEDMHGPVRAVKLALDVEASRRPAPDPSLLPGGRATASRIRRELPKTTRDEYQKYLWECVATHWRR